MARKTRSCALGTVSQLVVEPQAVEQDCFQAVADLGGVYGAGAEFGLDVHAFDDRVQNFFVRLGELANCSLLLAAACFWSSSDSRVFSARTTGLRRSCRCQRVC